MVHRRELNGKELVFGNQGALWGNAMTWWDHDTGSVWSQPRGEAIAGPRTGDTIELLPSNLTTWAAWLGEHPDSLALDAPGGNAGFDLESMAIAVDFTDEAAAFPVVDLRAFGVANDTVAGAPIAVFVDPTNDQRWNVVSRRLDDRILTFETRADRIVDIETGSAWDPVRGIAREGPLEGEILDLLPGFTVFPSDFFTFWPDGRLVTRGDGD